MSQASQGNFFAVGAAEFAAACELGMNPAVALLVLARGTGRDHVTTKWSALAVSEHTGIARPRAKAAIEALIGSGLVELLEIKAGKFPRYKLHRPQDDEDLIWLPNELISGAGEETPPVRRIRETGKVELLQTFIDLYSVQDLDNEGGIPRTLIWTEYQRELICPIGPFVLYGFNRGSGYASNEGVLAKLKDRSDGMHKGPWVALSRLAAFGLIEPIDYMAEAPGKESELIYPVNAETDSAMDDIVCWLDEKGGSGYASQTAEFDRIGIAPKHIEDASMVGMYRMKYRPKTGKTARWLAVYSEQTEALVGIVQQLCEPKSSGAVHIKASQGS